MRAHADGVLERDEDVVVDQRAGAARVDLGVDAMHRAEQRERLVDEMRAEVEQQPAALAGARQLAPRAASTPGRNFS